MVQDPGPARNLEGVLPRLLLEAGTFEFVCQVARSEMKLARQALARVGEGNRGTRILQTMTAMAESNKYFAAFRKILTCSEVTL
jgi:hypothetical protein